MKNKRKYNWFLLALLANVCFHGLYLIIIQFINNPTERVDLFLWYDKSQSIRWYVWDNVRMLHWVYNLFVFAIYFKNRDKNIYYITLGLFINAIISLIHYWAYYQQSICVFYFQILVMIFFASKIKISGTNN